VTLRLHLVTRCLGWTGLAILLALGLAGLAGLVEGVRFGASRALRLSAHETLPMVLPLVPLLCGVGAGAAAARTRSLGEEVALQAIGVDPRRVALLAGAVALGLATLGGLCQLLLSPSLAAGALAIRVEMGDAPAPSDWIWTGQEVVSLRDGSTVRAAGGRLLDRTPAGGPVSPELLDRARSVRMPFVARPADLLLPLPAMRSELLARLASAPAAALLAMMAWLGLGGTGRVGPAIGLGLGYQALAIVLGTVAASDHLDPWLAAALPLLSLAALLLLRWRAQPST